MKTITSCIVLVVLLLFVTQSIAQETSVSQQVETLKQEREAIIKEEKEALKVAVESINGQLENEEISKERAEAMKMDAAEKHALNIENKVAIIDNKIALLERNGLETESDEDEDNDHKIIISIFDEGDLVDVIYNKNIKYDRRTTHNLVFAFGLNNLITEGESLEDSDFKVWGSKFTELGWAWKTRVFKNSNWLRLKYGFSFQMNGLKPTDNRYFVDKGEETVLEVYPENLDKSKLRVDYLVFPVHFEFGPSTKIEHKDYFRYSTRRHVKFGIGGYGGFKIGSRQKLKYNVDGSNKKDKQKEDFNTSDFIYGLSGYIGWYGVGVYIKYDLNTIFDNNPVDQRNISLGLRFDMD